MRRALLTTAVALCAVVVSGCGGSSGPTEVAADPATSTSLSDRQEAALDLKGGPDWLAALDGLVWVKRDDGFVTKIDSASNEPAGDVKADTKSRSGAFCQGIGAGGGFVWSCSGSDVVRIDPTTLEVTDSIPVGKAFDQGRLVFAADRIWEEQIVPDEPLSGGDVLVTDDGLWATAYEHNLVLRLRF